MPVMYLSVVDVDDPHTMGSNARRSDPEKYLRAAFVL